MKFATPEETALRVKQYNEEQRALKRDKPYISLEIPAGIDTAGNDWKLHCLAMTILNQVTSEKREKLLNKLLEENPRVDKVLLPIMEELKQKFWEKA